MVLKLKLMQYPATHRHCITVKYFISSYSTSYAGTGGAVAEWVRESTDGSSPTLVKKILFGTLAIPFTPLCQCLSDETVKAVGPFCLVSMPGEVKYPTSPHWNV